MGQPGGPGRKRLGLVLTVLVILTAIVQGTWTSVPPTLHAQATESAFVPVDLTDFADNAGIGAAPGSANFDGAGDAYPGSLFPTRSVTVLGGIPLQLVPGSRDNVIALHQRVPVPAGAYMSAYLLVASSFGETIGWVTIHYADGSTSRCTLAAPDWLQDHETPVLASPTRQGDRQMESQPAGLFAEEVWVDPHRTVQSITLPSTRTPAPHVRSMHIFAISLLAARHGDTDVVTGARSTDKVSHGTQIVEAVVHNTGSVDHSLRNPLTVSVEGDGLVTLRSARLTRLPAGEETTVEVGIKRLAGGDATREIDALVVVHTRSEVVGMAPVTVHPLAPFDATEASLLQQPQLRTHGAASRHRGRPVRCGTTLHPGHPSRCLLLPTRVVQPRLSRYFRQKGPVYCWNTAQLRDGEHRPLYGISAGSRLHS